MIGITGLSGLLGRHVKEDFDSHTIKFKPIGRANWDLSEWKTDSELDDLFANCHTVVHMGALTLNNNLAESIHDMSNANIRSCINLCNWAIQKNIHIIYISGATVYKDVFGQSISEDDPKTVDNFGGFYGFTKKLAEDIVLHFKMSGLKATILRPSSIYGLGLTKDKMIMSFINSAIVDSTINISNPNSKINLVHAYDVAKSIRLAYLKKAEGIFNIRGFTHSIMEIANITASVISKKEILINVLKDNLDSSIRFNLNGDLAQTKLSYEPEIALEEGISQILKASK